MSSLILAQREDLLLSVFADQILSAQAWYNGNDAIAAEDALTSMIEDVVDGTLTIQEALNIAQQEVNQTL